MSETTNKLEYTEGMVHNTMFSAYSFKNKDVLKAHLKSYTFPSRQMKPIPFIKKNLTEKMKQWTYLEYGRLAC